MLLLWLVDNATVLGSKVISISICQSQKAKPPIWYLRSPSLITDSTIQNEPDVQDKHLKWFLALRLTEWWALSNIRHSCLGMRTHICHAAFITRQQSVRFFLYPFIHPPPTDIYKQTGMWALTRPMKMLENGGYFEENNILLEILLCCLLVISNAVLLIWDMSWW